MARVHHRVVGVAATPQQGADPVTDAPAIDPGADLIDHPRNLQPQDVRSPRRGRIAALSLEQIGPIDPRGVDADADLSGPDDGIGTFRQPEGLGRSGPAGDLDHPHARARSLHSSVSGAEIAASVRQGHGQEAAMMMDDLEPRPQRGATVAALGREDLDLYSVAELQERIDALQGEIDRARGAIDGKQAKKNAADALFNFRP